MALFNKQRKRINTPLAVLVGSIIPLAISAQSATSLPTLHVDAQQTANVVPVSTYETPISNLEFEPRVDLQSRNMAEAQGDVTIRGGIFENTGFRVGSATLTDPQTGHYFAELPIAPEMLSGLDVYTGTDNALYGFNSTVGSLSYGWSQIVDGGSSTIGGGDHDLNFQRIHHGLTGQLGGSAEWSWGAEAEYSRSESDGTINYADHDFERFSGRFQIVGPNSQTDLFAGYQDKFFGLFGMYTGEAFTAFSPFETEDLKTRLFMINHKHQYGDASSIEATAYTRRHSDHYQFNRFSPNNRFVHETKVHAIALAGTHQQTEAFAINYSTQLTSDRIESTNLENSFTSRDYFKISLVPEYVLQRSKNDQLTFSAGASFDDSNRNDSEVSAIARAEWQRTDDTGNYTAIYISYSESSQVSGYTAIGGGTSGLFASDPTLDRETSENLELGTRIRRQSWSLEAAIFYRWDDDLTDWTFEESNLNARTANPVDIETFGIEVIATKQWGPIEGIASYSYLHKDEDYGNPDIVGSFYALNFPEHRATLGLIWSPMNWVEVRIDNEWRRQEENALRSSDDSAFFTHATLSFYPSQIQGLEIFLSVDNAWEDDFQDVPGTPGRGDQYSAGFTYRW
ncbi:MAG TPA: TonB-dependent receptor [Opitutae bacterium]|nr:TonB-dependent receptor [Opitutae bacterium]